MKKILSLESLNTGWITGLHGQSFPLRQKSSVDKLRLPGGTAMTPACWFYYRAEDELTRGARTASLTPRSLAPAGTFYH